MTTQEKTINVSEKTWKRIISDKYNLGYKTNEDVILALYKIVGKIKKAEDKQ